MLIGPALRGLRQEEWVGLAQESGFNTELLQWTLTSEVSTPVSNRVFLYHPSAQDLHIYQCLYFLWLTEARALECLLCPIPSPIAVANDSNPKRLLLDESKGVLMSPFPRSSHLASWVEQNLTPLQALPCPKFHPGLEHCSVMSEFHREEELGIVLRDCVPGTSTWRPAPSTLPPDSCYREQQIYPFLERLSFSQKVCLVILSSTSKRSFKFNTNLALLTHSTDLESITLNFSMTLSPVTTGDASVAWLRPHVVPTEPLSCSFCVYLFILGQHWPVWFSESAEPLQSPPVTLSRTLKEAMMGVGVASFLILLYAWCLYM